MYLMNMWYRERARFRELSKQVSIFLYKLADDFVNNSLISQPLDAGRAPAASSIA